MGGLLEGSLYSQKRTKLDRWVQNRIIWLQSKPPCLEKSQHCIWKKELPPNSEAWWWKCEDLGLLFYKEPWILWHINKFLTRISCHQSGSWSWDKNGLCNKTMTQSIPAKLQRNGFRERGLVLWIGPVKVWALIQLKCCGETWNKVILMFFYKNSDHVWRVHKLQSDAFEFNYFAANVFFPPKRLNYSSQKWL